MLTSLAILGAAASFTPAQAEQSAPNPAKVLLITGGCCHDYTAQKDILKNGLEKRLNIEVTQIHSADTSPKPPLPTHGNPAYADGFDLVIHDECAAAIGDPAVINGIILPHKNGIPGINLHCAMHSYRFGTFRNPWPPVRRMPPGSTTSAFKASAMAHTCRFRSATLMPTTPPTKASRIGPPARRNFTTSFRSCPALRFSPEVHKRQQRTALKQSMTTQLSGCTSTALKKFVSGPPRWGTSMKLSRMTVTWIWLPMVSRGRSTDQTSANNIHPPGISL